MTAAFRDIGAREGVVGGVRVFRTVSIVAADACWWMDIASEVVVFDTFLREGVSEVSLPLSEGLVFLLSERDGTSKVGGASERGESVADWDSSESINVYFHLKAGVRGFYICCADGQGSRAMTSLRSPLTTGQWINLDVQGNRSKWITFTILGISLVLGKKA